MDFLSKNLYNLHAIGEIPRGQKINTRGECLSVEKESSFQWVKRLADGRSKVFRDINRYVSTVIEISTRIMESKYFVYTMIDAANEPDAFLQNDNNHEPEAKKINYDALKLRAARIEELRKIYHGLGEARRGIIGQQDTYKDDTDVCAIILDLTTKIDHHSTEIRKFIQSCGEPTDD